jgi:phage repressor protein C with HTH and peptisase S24 domain
MSNFIVHGDTVLFAANNTDRFEHGHIYALQTPDGPRIKRVLRKTDGQVILSNDNPDKIRFPDEVYSPEEAGRLDNIGRFIFRQG